MRHILTIGGIDPSGCAGILADLKAITAFGAHGMAVVAAITAQNTQRVDAVFAVDPETIRAQLKSIASDIPVHAVKIGLLADVPTIETVADLCAELRLTNIVVDSILRSTTGHTFGDKNFIDAYRRVLFPVADVITPNLDEASALTGKGVSNVAEMKEAARLLRECGCKNVVITGGHLSGHAIDILYDGESFSEFKADRVESENTRGLGCTFSSILAVHLARGENITSGILAAKKYIAQALLPSWKLGEGKGPLNFRLQP